MLRRLGVLTYVISGTVDGGVGEFGELTATKSSKWAKNWT